MLAQCPGVESATMAGDMFTLQQIPGYTTLEMVKCYVNLASDHVSAQHRKFSPMDRMKLARAVTKMPDTKRYGEKKAMP